MKDVILNRKLVLERPEHVADGAGGFAETWVEAGTLWAEVAARTGREAVSGGVVVSNTAYRITVRAAPYGAPSRPAPEQRFRDGTRLFRIESVAERDPTGRYLTCFCEEEVAT